MNAPTNYLEPGKAGYGWQWAALKPSDQYNYSLI